MESITGNFPLVKQRGKGPTLVGRFPPCLVAATPQPKGPPAPLFYVQTPSCPTSPSLTGFLGK